MTRRTLRPDEHALWTAVMANVQRSTSGPAPIPTPSDGEPTTARPRRNTASARRAAAIGVAEPAHHPSARFEASVADLAEEWRRLFAHSQAAPREARSLAVAGPPAAPNPPRLHVSPSPPPVLRTQRETPHPLRAAPQPPTERSHERKIRRGRVEIDGILDLHGLSLAQAEAAVARFVVAAHARGDDCIVVVTGKGRRRPARAAEDFTPQDGVLRRAFPDWLAMPAVRAVVAGFARAHDRHGGDGAWYVFLRRPPRHV